MDCGIIGINYGNIRVTNMGKRRIKKLGKSMLSKVLDRQFVECRECHVTELEVSGDVSSVVCPTCVQRWIAPPPESVKKEKSDKPRGWHLKGFFEKDGVVYSKGEVVTDKDQIKELRSTNGKSAVSAKKQSVKKPKTATKRGTKHARSTK